MAGICHPKGIASFSGQSNERTEMPVRKEGAGCSSHLLCVLLTCSSSLSTCLSLCEIEDAPCG